MKYFQYNYLSNKQKSVPFSNFQMTSRLDCTNNLSTFHDLTQLSGDIYVVWYNIFSVGGNTLAQILVVNKGRNVWLFGLVFREIYRWHYTVYTQWPRWPNNELMQYLPNITLIDGLRTVSTTRCCKRGKSFAIVDFMFSVFKKNLSGERSV